jgi:hypothetical protein
VIEDLIADGAILEVASREADKQPLKFFSITLFSVMLAVMFRHRFKPRSRRRRHGDQTSAGVVNVIDIDKDLPEEANLPASSFPRLNSG